MTDVTDLYDVVDDAILLDVHVQPGAGRAEVMGRHGHALKVKVAAPPVDGRANTAVVELLAHELGLEKADVTVVSGQKSASKRVRLAGLDPAEVETAIARLLPGGASRASGERH